MTTFGAEVADAASGSGVGHPGAVPYSFTRTSTGTYAINFDTRLRPMHVEVTGQIGGAIVATPSSLAPGAFTIQALTSAMALGNSNFRFTCTARDMRI